MYGNRDWEYNFSHKIYVFHEYQREHFARGELTQAWIKYTQTQEEQTQAQNEYTQTQEEQAQDQNEYTQTQEEQTQAQKEQTQAQNEYTYTHLPD